MRADQKLREANGTATAVDIAQYLEERDPMSRYAPPPEKDKEYITDAWINRFSMDLRAKQAESGVVDTHTA